MKKTIYLIRGMETETYSEFKKNIFALAEVLIGKIDVSTLKVVLTEHPPPSISIIPFKKKKIAVLSLKSKVEGLLPGIIVTEGFTGSYEVTEAMPVAYTKNWEDGEPTPGICLLTLFKQKKEIAYDTFIDR